MTDSKNSLAFGPGVLSGGCPNAPISFYIQARDNQNNVRVTGHDEFEVVIRKAGEEKEVEKTIHDEFNGRYLVTYTAPGPGKYEVSVRFQGTFGGASGPIRGSPFNIEFKAGADKNNNKFDGPLVMGHVKSEIKDLSSFGKTTLSTLRQDVPEDSLDDLLNVKNALFSVHDRDAAESLRIDRTRSQLAHLKDMGNKDVEKLSKQLEAGVRTWEDTKKQAPVTRAAIHPLVKSHGSQTKNGIEAYEQEVKAFVKAEKKREFWEFETGYAAAQKSLAESREAVKVEEERADRQRYLAKMFEFPDAMKKSNEMLQLLEDETAQVERLWTIAKECEAFFASSREQLFSEVKADDLEDKAKNLHKEMKKGPSKEVRQCGTYRGLDKTIKDFLATVPLVQALTHKSMRPRHWKMLMESTGKTFTPPHEDPNMKLGELLALNLHEFQADVEEITDQALKEEKMEDTLQVLEETWKKIEWLAEPYKEGSSVCILKIEEEDFESLENDQLTVQGMVASRFLATFETEVLGWQKQLAMVNEVVVLLTDIQRTWSYLEPLFISSEEVKRELPEDAERFKGIDENVKRILTEARETQNVLKACNREGLFEELEKIAEELDRCKKSLADYLDGKRRQFPRFYFVSEADLLDILSNGNTPSKIVRHITKVLLATDTLQLKDDGQSRPLAIQWISCVGKEDVEFEPPLRLEGKVEIYLQSVLDAQKNTLRARLEGSLKRFPTQGRIDWLMQRDDDGDPMDPAQITLLVSGARYVSEVEDTFKKIEGGDKDAMKKMYEHQVGQLNDLIRLTQGKLEKNERQRVMCMITLDAHGRDVIDKLIREHVMDLHAFQWQSQLKQRYEDGKAIIAVADARFDYGYEYLGNGPRLVVTPLTDRIYVTATQALNLKMGCAPAGPAGTGKTETTKDLASALGKCCYVFNCSPEMDYKSLGNIFKGLSASGSWGCFDEFNRLVPEVLSVCTVQFKAMCDAIRAQKKSVVIDNDEVSLDWTAGAFITMNPGYLGRSELPEGLKALFRPITVMVPDLVLICENMLMAEGFVEAKVLASKFYGLYSLLSELLSKQLHYDWGLRAVKSVLVVAGGFKRAEPDLPEQELLMRALRDFNVPKIVAQDNVIFFGLLRDLFPGMDPPRKVDPELEKAVQSAARDRKLNPDEDFCIKAVQLDELLAIRHCVFVMGPAAAGKTECWKTLAAARTVLNRKTKAVDLNPKAISPQELYGYITMATREWRDGVLSKVMRDLGNEPNQNPKWIVLDGDLDANWIESMNSVMDDNKMLTLASNERIPLKPHMRMIFEIRDLNFASPATVSRAGIIYISTDSGSQWKSLIASWVAKRDCPQEMKDVLNDCFDRYCPDTIRYLRKNSKPLVPVEPTTQVANLLRMLDVLMTEEFTKSLAGSADMPKVVETYFVFAAVWAFGSALSEKDGEDYRKLFTEFWRGGFKSVKMGSRDTVFDFWLNPETLKFESWKNSPYFQEVEYDSSTPMSSVTVPTPETCSVSYWMDLLVNYHVPIMLVGNAGCGKTQLVSGMLQKQDREIRTSTSINFNFYTTSQALQVALEAPLEKKTGTNYGPPGKSSMVYFLDDLNLPEVDPYNTQSAIALLRQHMDYGHWYDRNKLTLKQISNCQYVACMNPTAGSFTINPRLQRHFVTFAIGFPGPTSLHTIYNTFLTGHLKKFNEDIQEMTSNLVQAALGLHASVANTFRKSAVNFHYEFNIRHLSNVFQGLLMADPEQFSDPAKIVMLWLHESERVYGDRLVSLEDLARYQQLALAQAKKKFPNFNMANFFAAENPDPLIFCHFADNIQDKVYDRVNDVDHLNKVLVDALTEYNETNAQMDLVLFSDAMKHVCRIARIVLNDAGHALLVGVGGSGKRSLARLSAFICNYLVYTITISGSYGVNDLKEDLKVMYNKAGLKEEGVMFLFTDSQITNERFLVYLNDLLASGNIPDLYSQEEKDEIVNTITPRVKSAGIVPDKTNCWSFFISEVRKNLHVVLCFSPVGDDFRTRAKKFPALVNCTVIDWFQPWPEDALYSVGARFLSEVDLGSDEIRKGVEAFMPLSFSEVNRAAKEYFQSDGRYVYTTPKSYLELLKLYRELLGAKRDEFEKAIDRLSNGLLKLRETAESVVEIEADLKIKLEQAEEKRVTAEGIAEEVAKNKAIVEEETAKANVEAENCAKIKKEVSELQRTAEEDLAKAEPAVERAMAALDTLNKKDLGECKTMSTPPKGVDDIFAAVVVLLAGVDPNVPTNKAGVVKKGDREWAPAKKALLTNVNAFIDTLKGYKEQVDNYKVPDVNWKEVRPYLTLEHFVPEIIQTKNSAAAGLCAWVVNIVTYRDILVTVEPKRQALRAANEELAAASKKLEEVQAKVAELQAELDKLTKDFNAAEAEKTAAINEVTSGQRRLDLANRLTSALADENVRWAEGVEKLNQDKEVLVGDVLLASAFISYIGPFTKKYRTRLLKDKFMPFLEKAAGGERIPMSDDPDAMAILSTEAEVAEWNSQGLPDDRVSVENGAIVVNTARWPLIIDPQLQGIKWIREKESDSNLVVVRLGQKDMLRRLERAIDSGDPVLIENMGERIDAVLNPVISRSTVRKGHKRYIMLGDKEVEFHPKFRLYLHTKLSNPHYPPEVQAETALINFTVTEAGLEDQLLAMTVQKERADLAEARTALIQQQNLFKIKIKKLEDEILQRLAAAEGNITEDVELIESLENTKRIANDINVKVKIAKTTTATINETAEKYRPVAVRASLIFFLMNALSRVHTYYIYSLSAFVTVFLRAISLVSGDNDPMKDELEAAFEADEGGAAAEGEEEAAAAEPEDGGESSAQGEAAEASGAEGEAAESKGEDGGEAGAGEGEGQGGDGGEGEGEGGQPAEGGEAEAGAGEGADFKLKKGLNDEQLARRCKILMDSITQVAFQYINRGLFERDKLMVGTQLALKILVRDGLLNREHVQSFIVGAQHTDPGPMGPLSEWMPENLWPRVKALEEVKPVFEKIGDEMQSDSDAWRKWFDQEKPENVAPPGAYKQLSTFHLLLLLRALRPDRLTAALSRFIEENLGSEYIHPPPFSMEATYNESSPGTPIFFVLFPGVDPTTWVEEMGRQIGITADNGKFVNISMGQGQEAPAEAALAKFAEEGGWVFFQNVHLMQTWLIRLERKLELASEEAHENFRCFISAEPPPMAHMKNMPESLMQSCLKVANDAPADLLSNLSRAWANFSQERIDESNKPTEFKACLFTLCFYHAIILGRRRFGQQGFSKRYSFNTGDLTVCANVLMDYINNSASVPWDDLRYIFGEIMYGGHITDAWDRRTNNTYLHVYLEPGILTGRELGPGFATPDFANSDFDALSNYITEKLPKESPPMFGLHPNAEVGYLTTFADDILKTILGLEGAGGGGGGGGSERTKVVRNVMDDLLSRLPENFSMIDIQERAEPMLQVRNRTRMRALRRPQLHFPLFFFHFVAPLWCASLPLSLPPLSPCCPRLCVAAG